MKCIFCEKPNQEDLIFSTKYWNVILSWNQAYFGMCLVVLKRHCSHLSQLKKSEWDEFSSLVKKLELSLKKSFDATMFNWICLMNDAYKSKTPEAHIHWKGMPRYNHKVEFAGKIFEDLEFGHHYDKTRKVNISESFKKAIIGKIKEN